MRTTARAIVIRDGQLLVMQRNKFGKEYYALVGGAVEIGESTEAALHRELMEETSITVTSPRLVIEEDAGEIYGLQYIYLCDYASGEPTLAPDSPEAEISKGGQNLYKPMWLPVKDLATTNLLPHGLRDCLVELLEKGFPETVVKLTIDPQDTL